MKYEFLYLIQNKLLVLFLLYIALNNINSYVSFNYPNSLSLSNGNIFIIHKFGISICNPNLTEIITNITNFEEEDIITQENLSKITSVIENGFIFNIINDKIYIFDDKGTLLYNNSTKIISVEENPCIIH